MVTGERRPSNICMGTIHTFRRREFIAHFLSIIFSWHIQFEMIPIENKIVTGFESNWLNSKEGTEVQFIALFSHHAKCHSPRSYLFKRHSDVWSDSDAAHSEPLSRVKASTQSDTRECFRSSIRGAEGCLQTEWYSVCHYPTKSGSHFGLPLSVHVCNN